MPTITAIGTPQITLGGTFTMSGPYTFIGNLTGNTNVTFPTSGTLATTSGAVPGIIGTANQVLANGTSGVAISGTNVTLTTPQNIATTSSPTFNALTLTTPLSVANGGTSKTSVTTAPTATSWAGWDANSNISANSLLPGFTSVVSAAGNTILTVASSEIIEITGSTTQTVTMPVTTTLVAGKPYSIINNSSGNVTVRSSGANAIQVMAAGSQLNLILLVASGTTAASWQSSYIIDNGLAGAVLLNPPGDQFILNGTLGVNNGSVYSGVAGGGSAPGTFVAFASGVSAGGISFFATNNAGDYLNTFTNASTTASRGWTLPDATGTIALTSGGGLQWSTISGTSQAAEVGFGYIVGNASQTTISLPPTAPVGSTVSIVGLGAAGWILQPAGGQTIKIISVSAGTSVTTTNSFDCITVVCAVANTTWVAIDMATEYFITA